MKYCAKEKHPFNQVAQQSETAARPILSKKERNFINIPAVISNIINIINKLLLYNIDKNCEANSSPILKKGRTIF